MPANVTPPSPRFNPSTVKYTTPKNETESSVEVKADKRLKHY
jgi:hypothetical protein